MDPVKAEKASMQRIDISGNRRINAFVEMAKEIAHSDSPDAALGAFVKASGIVHGWAAHMHVSSHGLSTNEYRILRFELAGHHEVVPRADLPGMSHSPEVHTGGFIGEVIDSAAPKVFHSLNVEDDPVVGNTLKEYKSMAAVPMFFRGDATDWILLLHKDSEGATENSLEEMILGSNLIGSNITKAQIMDRLVSANERIELEVENIAEIQRSLLPTAMPDIPGVAVAANYETFDRAGGDYYDFLPLSCDNTGRDPSGLWGIIIADASGHGPAAAVVMAMVHTLFHSYHKTPESAVELLEYINENLQSNRIHYSFVTAWIGIYDPHSRILRYACAGHDAPLLMNAGRPEDMKRLDDVRGFPLGVEAQVGSGEASVTLEPGQTLVLYTDGITESESPDRIMFRTEGIEKALVTCNGEPDCVILEVMDALKEHEAGLRSRDDQTIVALQVAE